MPDKQIDRSLQNELHILDRASNALDRAISGAQVGISQRTLKDLDKVDTLLVAALIAVPDLSLAPVTSSLLLARLERLVEAIVSLQRPSGLGKRELRKIEEIINHLKKLLGSVGPSEPRFIFDPGAFRTIAHVIATALFAQEKRPLSEIRDELGSGIYALFYAGPLDFYGPISGVEVPIYVGSAVPGDHEAKDSKAQGATLYRRLRDHHKAVKAVEDFTGGRNLRIRDFHYRRLVVRSGWELAAEQYLIRHFKPVWNKETKVCQGLGKHGDNSSTRNNTRSPWDTLHPGRKWATTDAKYTEKDLQERIAKHFVKHPPRPISIDDILK